MEERNGEMSFLEAIIIHKKKKRYGSGIERNDRSQSLIQNPTTEMAFQLYKIK